MEMDRNIEIYVNGSGERINVNMDFKRFLFLFSSCSYHSILDSSAYEIKICDDNSLLSVRFYFNFVSELKEHSQKESDNCNDKTLSAFELKTFERKRNFLQFTWISMDGKRKKRETIHPSILLHLNMDGLKSNPRFEALTAPRFALA
ncbi:CLUMA_CG003167, isoform A [Clunio marinus]|uniref:CLUMA_CG003167, isoform A n=1 Tax=Clunio marinus TaxID=568069 RepID=A0A1J1HPF9_9DIPT|nr:CLUMA_CG003167, isoform A [Clunio marinus]